MDTSERKREIGEGNGTTICCVKVFQLGRVGYRKEMKPFRLSIRKKGPKKIFV